MDLVNLAKEQANGFLNLAKNTFAKIMPNGLREKALENPDFPHSKPVLFLFIASQILTSLLPSLLLLVFGITTILFIILAALLFVLTCLLFVLLVAVPGAIFAASLVFFLYIFGVGGYSIAGSIIRLVCHEVEGSKEHQS